MYFFGYVNESKGYGLYNQHSMKLIIQRDVFVYYLSHKHWIRFLRRKNLHIEVKELS